MKHGRVIYQGQTLAVTESADGRVQGDGGIEASVATSGDILRNAVECFGPSLPLAGRVGWG